MAVELRESGRFALLCLWLSALLLSLSACDDRLPGFARPPPYDAGSGGDAAPDDADAGSD